MCVCVCFIRQHTSASWEKHSLTLKFRIVQVWCHVMISWSASWSVSSSVSSSVDVLPIPAVLSPLSGVCFFFCHRPISSSPDRPRSVESSRPPLPSEKAAANAMPSAVSQNHRQVLMWGGGIFKPTALAVPGDSQPVAVALGRTHQLALTGDSRVLSWQVS